MFFFVVDKLREDLCLIVVMGEYFEYFCFGMMYMKWVVENNIGFYCKFGVLEFSRNLSEVVVFIVGNGFFFDNLLFFLKEEREWVIVIFCGIVL